MGWLGILAEAPPMHHELVYCANVRGFALFTMRSPTVSRLYLQCRPDEDINDWSDDRIWEEFALRLKEDDERRMSYGPILQKGDNFRDPDRPRDKLRYMSEFLTGAGGKPSVSWTRESVNAK